VSARDYWGRPPYNAIYDEEGFPRDAKRDEHYYAALALKQYADHLDQKRPVPKIYKDYTDDFLAVFGHEKTVQHVRLETLDPLFDFGNVHFVLWYAVGEKRYGIKAVIFRYQTHELDTYNRALYYTLVGLSRSLDQAIAESVTP